MQEEEDTSFVSINLEPSECSICSLDTGEPLTTCHLCSKKPSPRRSPIQIGFNQLPDVLHTEVKAHETCLVLEHQRFVKKSRSPFLHRRGCSVPQDFSSPGARESIGNKLQWLINQSKNEDVKNRKNLLQVHSSPCTRSSSPVPLRGVSEIDILRRNSEQNLSCESGSVELRKSYAKYLYGTRLTQSQSDDNVVIKTQSINSETQITRTTTVPDVRDIKSPLSIKDSKKTRTASENDEQFDKSTRVRSNKIEMTEGLLTPMSDKLCRVLSLQDEGAEKRDVESETRRWSNKQKLNKEQLNKMSAAEMKKVLSNYENMIKEISADLVDFLQERDSLDQEVKVRNLTIQKLVKMKHQQQQDMPIKTAAVSNI
ncbi:uncharacterized protein [Asterias amurensis]|uniref:uncharacterized protein n=1 Tax=Asterias amurensis TaxID=7602 RepID=UPI003AB783CF